MSLAYRLTARNTALESSNRIHSDDVARLYGFGGGLVPGVTSYAYLTHPVVERWGRDWLEHGTLSARLTKPVYDGESIEVTLAAEGQATLFSRGEVCASGVAGLDRSSAQPAVLSRAEVPLQPPDASRSAFEARPILGSITTEITPERAAEYLAKIGEDLSIYAAEGLVHPGFILGEANEILMANVVLPPWIHVESQVRNLAAVAIGETIETRARVSSLHERKGHQLVELEVLVLTAGGVPAASIRHVAIYQLRPPGAPPDL